VIVVSVVSPSSPSPPTASAAGATTSSPTKVAAVESISLRIARIVSEQAGAAYDAAMAVCLASNLAKDVAGTPLLRGVSFSSSRASG